MMPAVQTAWQEFRMDDAGHSNDLRNGGSNSCHHPFKQQVLNQSTFNETSNFAIAVLIIWAV